MSTYVFGDIQGCYDELMSLLDRINYDPGRDRLWFVGDLVNRGPGNLATIEFIMGLPDAVVVLGNHDLHFLGVATGVSTQKKLDTLDDLLLSPALMDIVDWLRRRPLIYHDDEFDVTMVHAGLPPIWSIDFSLERATEVTDVLASDSFKSFLKAMYGNKPACWTEQLTGMDRLRVITNYCTRMRFCQSDGTLDLISKEDIAPAGFAPWFKFPGPSLSRPIYFGHWAAIEGVTTHPNAIALDTGCVWGRHLTVIRIEDGQRFSVPAARANQ
jgi:bis(5'-nucleosyl)-tetraphosphatase (symmetrical)